MSAHPPQGQSCLRLRYMRRYSLLSNNVQKGAKWGWEGRPRVPAYETGIFPLSPCRMRLCDLPTMAWVLVTLLKCQEGLARCSQWPSSHCPALGRPELCAEQVALPTQSEAKNAVIWLPGAFISVAFLTVAGTKGVGVLRTLGDSGNVSLPPQIPAVLAVWNSHPSC